MNDGWKRPFLEEDDLSSLTDEEERTQRDTPNVLNYSTVYWPEYKNFCWALLQCSLIFKKCFTGSF